MLATSRSKRFVWVPTLALALAALPAVVAQSGSRQAPTGLGQARRTATLRPPDQNVGVLTAAQIAAALDIDPADVVSISQGTSDIAASDVFTAAVGSMPVEGASYFVMSTGNTSSALLPNTDPDTSTVLGGLDNSQGNDLVQTVLVLRPPAGATCVAFDFAFYSEEFPEFVGSEYNDAFIAEIGQSTFQIVDNQVIAPNNFAFDAVGNVISINTTFGATEANAAGTTYDGATPLLTAVSPLEDLGADITITLSIMDLGDSIYDSTVFIDDVRWFFGLTCLPGADADSDGDALLDDWETNGLDYDGDGTVDLDLPAMGADPMHKDIFIEIDYMVLAGAGGHTHEPKAAALQIVIDSFANAPLTNPDGTTGVRMHIDAGSGTIMDPVTNATWGTRSRSDVLAHTTNLGTLSGPNYDWTAFDAIKGAGAPGAFGIERADVFHYCIFGHSLAAALTTTSGISRGIPASDFLVTLGGWTGDVGSVNEQGGTLMHELGHGLNLTHGGVGHGNYKPNYLSIMNYFFQTRGLRVGGADGTFDYSRFLLPDLDESDLDETVGLSGVAGTAGYGTRYFSGGVQRIANDINGPIDWNADGDGGTDTSVAVDINGSGGLSTLVSSDNWAEVRFDGGAVGHLGEDIDLPMETLPMDIDEETDSEVPSEYKPGVGGPGTVTAAACDTVTVSFTVSNDGELSDNVALQVSTVQSWADTSALPAIVGLAPGESVTYDVLVMVPMGTPNGTMDVITIQATSEGNPLMMDTVETVVTSFSEDSDGDGLTDECDACPDSNLAPIISIDGCFSGVPNHLFDDGCTMSDLIEQCQAGASNHGQFVSCVSHLTNEWKQSGLITGQEKGAIVRCAAQSR